MGPGVLVYAFSLLFDKSATVGTTRADETTTPTIGTTTPSALKAIPIRSSLSSAPAARQTNAKESGRRREACMTSSCASPPRNSPKPMPAATGSLAQTAATKVPAQAATGAPTRAMTSASMQTVREA